MDNGSIGVSSFLGNEHFSFLPVDRLSPSNNSDGEAVVEEEVVYDTRPRGRKAKVITDPTS
jgi:hypothetical protein